MAGAARVCLGVRLALAAAGFMTAVPATVLGKAVHHRPASHHAAKASTHTKAPARTRSQSVATHKASTRPAAAHKASTKSVATRKASTKSVAAHRARTKPATKVAQHSGSAAVARRGKAKSAAPERETIRPLIVIDAGHGGRDPGAIGPGGTREKDITLAMALELRRMLDATGRYRTALTRTRDETVSLPARLAFARGRDADLLIAIHADASPDRHARGASVYVSSGSKVRHLAASAGNSGRIAQALSDGEPRPTPGSAWLQYSMIDQLSDEVDMVVAPARAAHLYVLGSRSIPGVLLETGFISNRQEEALLRKRAHRRRLVGAVKDAVDDYFRGIRAGAPRT